MQNVLKLKNMYFDEENIPWDCWKDKKEKFYVLDHSGFWKKGYCLSGGGGSVSWGYVLNY